MLCMKFRIIHNCLLEFILCHTTSSFRQKAQIEHFSYTYFRVLILACDGRRRGDPNGGFEWQYVWNVDKRFAGTKIE